MKYLSVTLQILSEGRQRVLDWYEQIKKISISMPNSMFLPVSQFHVLREVGCFLRSCHIGLESVSSRMSAIELHDFKIASASGDTFLHVVDTHCSPKLSIDIKRSQGFIQLLLGAV